MAKSERPQQLGSRAIIRLIISKRKFDELSREKRAQIIFIT